MNPCRHALHPEASRLNSSFFFVLYSNPATLFQVSLICAFLIEVVQDVWPTFPLALLPLYPHSQYR